LKWAPLFQACCLNFESFIVEFGGERLSLQKELSFALQFTRLDIDQINTFQNFDIPPEIEALDARLRKGMSEAQLADLEYQFRVIYTLDNVSKGKAGIQFIKCTEEAKEIKNVLLKYKLVVGNIHTSRCGLPNWYRPEARKTGDYTYSEKWIAFLCEKVATEEEFNKIKAIKVN
jgi:hypothetical protein